MQRFDARMGGGGEGVGHSLLGIVILALGALLAFSIATALEIDLPDPRAILDSIRTGRISDQAATRSVAVAAKPAAEAAAAEAAAAPFCGSGQKAVFLGGFADLKQHLGTAMGEPIECEHVNPKNGDYLQQTTTGLAVYEHATGRLRFTDGWKHWELTPGGIVTWEGESTERPQQTAQAATKPAAAGAARPAATPAPSPTPRPAEQGQRVRVANTDGIGVAVRASPSMNDRLPQAFPPGAELTVLERSGQFVRVRGANGLEGWVPGQYVAPVNP